MNFLLSFFLLFNSFTQNDGIREFDYNGKKVKTTFKVESQFIGKYAGRKSGFLKLNENGTGEYKYDQLVFPVSGCTSDPIQFEWGFILDDNGKPVKFSREYGFSYPILLKSTSKNSFKGCRDQIVVDFIIEKDQALHISSSDDWKKAL